LMDAVICWYVLCYTVWPCDMVIRALL